jgi:MFS family permease
MNSLGAGGEEKPYLVNGANALTFCLMVVSCFFSSVIVKRIGIKWALVFGTMGYAPYAAGLYTNNRFGTEWFVLFGAALCGISAGVFWMAEAAIALSYPEPYNQGRFLGFWLSFRIGGQVVGGVSCDEWYVDSADRPARQSTSESTQTITRRAKCRTTST